MVQSVPLEWKWPGASGRWLGGLGWLRELLRRPCWPLPVWAPALGAEVAGATSPYTPYLECITLSYPFADTLPHPHPLSPLLVGGNSVWQLKHRLAASGWNCTQTSLSLAPHPPDLSKGPYSEGPASPCVHSSLGLGTGRQVVRPLQKPLPRGCAP